MPTKSYTPISGFWSLAVPAVVFGLGYYLWHSQGFLSMELRQALGPLVSFVGQMFARLL
jgi:hypothetical protein